MISRNYRRNWTALLITACCLIVFSAALVRGQAGLAFRTFQPKNITSFRVELRVRTEVEGQKPAPIGAKIYLQPVSTWVEQNLSWQTTRRIVSIDAGGSAEVEEKLSNFSASATTSDENADKKKLLADLESALNPWKSPRTLQYRETRVGQISRLTADAAPPVDESAPRVLTAWLLRALRPTAALPGRPLALDEHWQEPRVVQFAEWTETTGSEAGEWLGNPPGIRQRGEPTIKLQTTQEISGVVTGGAEKPAEAQPRRIFTRNH